MGGLGYANCQLLTTELKAIKVGTLNVQESQKEDKQQFIYKDALKYDLQIFGLTETHVAQEDIMMIKVRHQIKQWRYEIYYGEIQGTNQYTGTGFLIEESLNPRFKWIRDRISNANIHLNDDQYVTVIIAYAPNSRKSEQNPSIKRKCYDQLNSPTSEHKNNKHLILVISDFKSKTSSAYPSAYLSESMGKFGKEISNSNGEHLLEYAIQNGLVLRNALFPHKMAHRTTWTSQEKVEGHLSSDGTSRCNPYRNQIDYIICKTCTKSCCRNEDHMVEQGQKPIKNWLKILLNWTGGDWS